MLEYLKSRNETSSNSRRYHRWLFGLFRWGLSLFLLAIIAYTVPIKDIWDSEHLKHYRNRDCFEGKCKDCKRLKKCAGCRAFALATTNSEFGEDLQCFY